MKICNVCGAFGGQFTCLCVCKLYTARALTAGRRGSRVSLAGSWATYTLFPARQLFWSKTCVQSARRVDLTSTECIKEVIAAQGLHRCQREVQCFCSTFVLPPLCWGAFCTLLAHLYSFKLNIKPILVFLVFFF